MAKVGAQRAAVLTGKSKSTIQRAMNSGKLSFELDQNKRRIIDVSELERVFGIQQTATEPQKIETVSTTQIDEAVEQERTRMKVKMLEEQLETAQELIDDLKSQRDKWEKQASQVLLTSQYSQKQAEELQAQIKEREERIKQRRLQNAKMQNAQSDAKSKAPTSPEQKAAQRTAVMEERMRKLKAQNENTDNADGSVFRFWKRARD